MSKKSAEPSTKSTPGMQMRKPDIRTLSLRPRGAFAPSAFIPPHSGQRTASPHRGNPLRSYPHASQRYESKVVSLKRSQRIPLTPKANPMRIGRTTKIADPPDDRSKSTCDTTPTRPRPAPMEVHGSRKRATIRLSALTSLLGPASIAVSSVWWIGAVRMTGRMTATLG